MSASESKIHNDLSSALDVLGIELKLKYEQLLVSNNILTLDSLKECKRELLKTIGFTDDVLLLRILNHNSRTPNNDLCNVKMNDNENIIDQDEASLADNEKDIDIDTLALTLVANKNRKKSLANTSSDILPSASPVLSDISPSVSGSMKSGESQNAQISSSMLDPKDSGNDKEPRTLTTSSSKGFPSIQQICTLETIENDDKLENDRNESETHQVTNELAHSDSVSNNDYLYNKDSEGRKRQREEQEEQQDFSSSSSSSANSLGVVDHLTNDTRLATNPMKDNYITSSASGILAPSPMVPNPLNFPNDPILHRNPYGLAHHNLQHPTVMNEEQSTSSITGFQRVRPRGRAPKGKKWNPITGGWEVATGASSNSHDNNPNMKQMLPFNPSHHGPTDMNQMLAQQAQGVHVYFNPMSEQHSQSQMGHITPSPHHPYYQHPQYWQYPHMYPPEHLYPMPYYQPMYVQHPLTQYHPPPQSTQDEQQQKQQQKQQSNPQTSSSTQSSNSESSKNSKQYD